MPTSSPRAQEKRRVRREKAKAKLISPEKAHAFVDELFNEDFHVKRVRSLADGCIGVLQSASLAVHAIGRGLAASKGLMDKHAIKQVDRLIGNEGMDPALAQARLVQEMVPTDRTVYVNMDWTDFDRDDQTMLVLSLQTDHGRSQPLMWQTVVKSELKDQRNGHEDTLLVRFVEALPSGAHVVIVADRGFGDQKLFRFLEEHGLEYIIRIRGCIHVTDEAGKTQTAADWVGANGKMCVLRRPRVTAEQTPVGVVVAVRDPDMKDSWCLVASDPGWSGAEIKRRYGKRFTCEETFRDLKDWRFGMGMRWTRVRQPARRDRLMLLAVIAILLITLLGAAGEAAGLDRGLKSNTSKKRTLSLLRQGLRWYELIPNMPDERLKILNPHDCLREAAPRRPVLPWFSLGRSGMRGWVRAHPSDRAR